MFGQHILPGERLAVVNGFYTFANDSCLTMAFRLAKEGFG